MLGGKMIMEKWRQETKEKTKNPEIEIKTAN